MPFKSCNVEMVINGISDKDNTIGTAEISGGKYISFPKPLLKGNYYISYTKYILFNMYKLNQRSCDHVTD